MPDEGTVHYEEQQGVVTLTCGDEAFARLTAAIAAVGPAVVVPAAAQVVVLRRAEPPGPPPNRWLDAIGYLGCAGAAMAVIGLLGAGAYTVSSWLW